MYNSLKLIRKSRPLYWQSLLGTMLYQADIILVATFFSEGIVGIYGVLARMVNSIGIIREVYVFSTLSKFVVYLGSKDSTSLKEYSRKLSNTFLFPLFVVTVIMGICSSGLIDIVFGYQPENTLLLFIILLCSHLGFVLFGSTDHLLIATNREKYVLRSSLYAFAGFLLLGPISAAFGSVLWLALIVTIQRNTIFLLGRYYRQYSRSMFADRSGINI